MFSMPTADAAAVTRTTKKRRADTGEAASEEAQMRRLCVLTSKLTLSTAQSARATKALLMDVMLMDAKMPMVTCLLAASKTYAESTQKVEAKDRVKVIGMVHHHMWNALLGHITATTQNKEDLQAALDTYKSSMDQLASKGASMTDIFLDQVRYLRLAKCYDQNKRRLEIYTVPSVPPVAQPHQELRHEGSERQARSGATRRLGIQDPRPVGEDGRVSASGSRLADSTAVEETSLTARDCTVVLSSAVRHRADKLMREKLSVHGVVVNSRF
eukprot:TRINITY_DN53925_c0_g2_i1.p1 TRINITY_DN53925_c0_g2~~TRINITY_DN53925_c0_g2_i1.p1  ORF type:complete len:271 (-),score=37.38 TRINITY_DN53925_c0_g2_i1:182-994(-)